MKDSEGSMCPYTWPRGRIYTIDIFLILRISVIYQEYTKIFCIRPRFFPDYFLHINRIIRPSARPISSTSAKQFGERSVPMEADARLLFQAFSNLLANAIKYSPNGGLITIDATTADGHASVELIDRGVGIPEMDQQRIFDRYFCGSNITGIVGTGIGLYLVKTVVDLHGGSVSVASQVGNGTQFSVRLPERARLHEAEA